MRVWVKKKLHLNVIRIEWKPKIFPNTPNMLIILISILLSVFFSPSSSFPFLFLLPSSMWRSLSSFALCSGSLVLHHSGRQLISPSNFIFIPLIQEMIVSVDFMCFVSSGLVLYLFRCLIYDSVDQCFSLRIHSTIGIDNLNWRCIERVAISCKSPISPWTHVESCIRNRKSERQRQKQWDFIVLLMAHFNLRTHIQSKYIDATLQNVKRTHKKRTKPV